jgi:RNA polymerase sigma factor for flagellar operon FliA
MKEESFEVMLKSHELAVHKVAASLRRSSGGALTHKELFQHGVAGLFEAHRRFDPTQRAQFWTFAFTRVRGEMIDAIRRQMPLPRRVHLLVRSADEAVASAVTGSEVLAAEDERMEASEELGLFTDDALSIVLGEELALPVYDADDEEEAHHASARFRAPAPARHDRSTEIVRTDAATAEDQLGEAQQHAALHAAMHHLAIDERMIVRGLYFENRGLTEIGAELGISKSWASRIHTRAIGRLKELLADGIDDCEPSAWAEPHRREDLPALLRAA